MIKGQLALFFKPATACKLGGKFGARVGLLNGVLVLRGGNSNRPIFKSSNALGFLVFLGRGVLMNVDHEFIAVHKASEQIILYYM